MLTANLERCYQNFGFSEPPFSITPDTTYFFPSRQHKDAYLHLWYGMTTGDLTLLTGEVGLGKTLLCRYLLRNAPPHMRMAYLFHPDQSYPDLLRSIYKDLVGHDLETSSLGTLQWALYEVLLHQAEEGKRVALIVDEAHRLTPTVLEGLRLLSNLETEKEKLLSLLLIGQPELEDILRAKALRPLAQRISVRVRLHPFHLEDTFHYIKHRLTVQGNSLTLRFEPSSMLVVHWLSQGIPRRINQISSRAILAAYATDQQTVRPHMVWRASREVMRG